jgi:tetratricopeptide (TPR) repeat protein
MSIVNEALKKAAREDTKEQAAEKHRLSFSARSGFFQVFYRTIPVIFLILLVGISFTQRSFLLRWWSQLRLTLGAVKTPMIAMKPSDIQSVPSKLPVPSSAERTVEQKAPSGREESDRMLIAGVQFYKEMKFKEAEQEFTKVLALQPGNAVAHNNLGLVLKAQERLPEAEAQYSAALQSNPQYPEALNNLALLYEQQGRVQEAIQQYRKALDISPRYPEAHLNYAQLLERAGYLEEARRHYQSFLAADNGVSPSLRLRVEQHLNSLP